MLESDPNLESIFLLKLEIKEINNYIKSLNSDLKFFQNLISINSLFKNQIEIIKKNINQQKLQKNKLIQKIKTLKKIIPP